MSFNFAINHPFKASLCVFFIPIAIAPAALAQSITPANDGTGTVVTPQGETLEIHGGQLSGDGANLFHSFEEFGLSEGQIANFLSNPNIENILGRVVGGDASYINGLLQVTGGDSNLFLINPAGIVFGASASLNVGGDFTATTATGIGFGENELDVFGENSWSSLVGNPDAFAFARANPGSIVNEGNLAVESGQNLGLFGGTVVNTGTLSAVDGNITLMAVEGESLVRLSAAGNVLSLDVAEAGIGDEDFTPLSLPQLLAGGENFSHASQIAVNDDGTVSLVGSDVEIDPKAGTAIASGQLRANGNASTIQVLGNQVAVLGATLDVSGTDGGGEIFIGGDFQGLGTIPNARVTLVDGNTQIFADALQQGDGGRVILWADETTAFLGNINARGSSSPTPHTPHPTPSNGGFVEVSGKQNLIFEGTVDLSASGGNVGTLLLDPTNITISNNPSDPPSPDGVEDWLPNIFASDFDGEDITINASVLESQIGEVILEATNDIEIAPGVSLNFAANGGAISFTANSDAIDGGSFLMHPDDSIQAEGRDVTISGASVFVGTIDTFSTTGDGGSISLNATNGEVRVNSIDTSSYADVGNGGAIDLAATGDITTGDLTASTEDGDGLGGNITLTTSGGNIDTSRGVLTSTSGNIWLDERLSVDAGSGSGGTVHLTADGDITGGSIVTTAENIGGAVVINSGGAIEITDELDAEGTEGQIITRGHQGLGGDITLNAEGDIFTDSIIASSFNLGADVTFNSNTGEIVAGSIDVRGDNTEAGSIDLTARGDIATADITGISLEDGATVTLESTEGAIDTTWGIIDLSGKHGGTVDITAAGDITTGEIYTSARRNGGGVTLTSTNGAVDTTDGLILTGGDIALGAKNAGTIDITADGNITTGELGTFGRDVAGAVNLTSTNGAIDATGGAIDASAQRGTGGAVGLTASGDITTSDIYTSGAVNGGNITFNSSQGGIDTRSGFLDASGEGEMGIGGAIALNAELDIITGELLSTGNPGGDITLESTSGAIDTSGGSIGTNNGDISLLAPGEEGSITIGNLTIAEDGTDASFTAENGDVTADPNLVSQQTGEVSLLAHNDITIEEDIITDSVSYLEFKAGRSIYINADIDTFDGDGDIFLQANSDDADLSLREAGPGGIFQAPGTAISSSGGDITLEVGTLDEPGDIVLADLYTIGGNISVFGGEGVNIDTTAGIIDTAVIVDGDPGSREERGAISLEAGGDITTGIVATRASNLGDGDIWITSGGAIDTSASYLESLGHNSGDITLEAVGDITTGPIISRGIVNSGDITLTSTDGSIDTTQLNDFDVGEANLDTFSRDGDGGNITLEANGDITTFEILSEGATRSGDIDLTSTNGNISITHGPSIFTLAINSHSDGEAGDITLSANGAIETEDIKSDGDTESGDLVIISQNNSVNTGSITTQSDGGDSGEIIVNGTTVATGNLTSLASGDSGDITVTATDGSVTTLEITSESETGDSGDITVTATEDVTTGDIRSIAFEDSGEITVTSTGGNISTGNITSRAETGTAGDIALNAAGAIDTGNVTAEGAMGNGTVSINESVGAIAPVELPEELETIEPELSQEAIVETAIVVPENNRFEPEENVANVSETTSLSNRNNAPIDTTEPFGVNLDPAPILTVSPEAIASETTRSRSFNPEIAANTSLENEDIDAIAQKANPNDVLAISNSFNVLGSPAMAISTTEVAAIDRQRNREYATYFGEDRAEESGGVENAADALGRIAAETGNQSAVVYVNLLPEQIELVLFTPDGVPVRQVVPNVTKEDVLATARELRRYITTVRYRDSDRYLESAGQLYQWLIAPLKDELDAAATDTLLFSMDEGLRALPIAALHDGKQFLVEQYSFSMIPSLSLIDTRYRALQNTQALAMGASTFAELNPLPAVPVELSTITQQIWQGEAFIDERFTRSNLVAERQEFPYPIIHLATHGEFQSGDPSNSYIQLWDEKLRLDELRQLGWNNPAVELLVLSACRTAVGDADAELGFAGLAVAAGVKSAMASLWYVSDEGTLALMTELYSHLENSPIKAEALRQAQISMIRGNVKVEAGELRGSRLRGGIPLPPELAHIENTNLSHPYYWSAFTTIGSPW